MDVRSVTANGLTHAYLESGDAAGPLALLIHGFPDTPMTWRLVRDRLDAAGFRVVTPWLRGYAPSALAPDGNYQTGALAADAVALHEALAGDERAVIVGHDYGASAAYGAAAHAPERFRRVAILSIPPRRSYLERGLAYDQLKRGWYMHFFQSRVAQKAVAANGLAFLERLWRDWSPGYDPQSDMRFVREAIGSEERLAAALRYYHYALGNVPLDERLAPYQLAIATPAPQPLLYLHGVRDGCVGIEMTDGIEAFFGKGSRVERIEGAGHFVQLERPDVVGSLLAEFLAA